jgi:hypothetical protein
MGKVACIHIVDLLFEKLEVFCYQCLTHGHKERTMLDGDNVIDAVAT